MNYVLKPIFPTAMFWKQIDAKIADEAEELFVSNLDKLPQKGIHQTDFHEEQPIINLDTDLPNLKKEIMEAIAQYTEATGIAASEDMNFNSWSQDYSRDKQYHPVHAHGLHGVSGIYWVRANEHAGDTVFHTPNPYTDLVKRHKETEVTTSVFGMRPTKGVVVIFPAFLQHEVMPSKQDAIRSTIAFNLCQ